MMGVWNAVKCALRAMKHIAPAAVLIGILTSSATAAAMEGCSDYVKSCPCPVGCGQGYCERVCWSVVATENHCVDRCGQCQCLAWASRPLPRLLEGLRFLVPAATAMELSTTAPKGVREISNPDGDFVVMPKSEARRIGRTAAGIGVAIRQSSGIFVISAVEVEGPAAKAGLKVGDEILQVDGKRTKGGSLQQVVEWIRGQSGTMVSLLVRGKDGTEKKLPLVRVPRETFRRPEPPDVTAKTVPVSQFKNASCPKVMDGCNFLVMEDGACVFTCRRSE